MKVPAKIASSMALRNYFREGEIKNPKHYIRNTTKFHITNDKNVQDFDIWIS